MYSNAYMNKRLGDCWREGCKWALTDVHGIQMDLERCLQFDECFQKVTFYSLVYSACLTQLGDFYVEDTRSLTASNKL